MSLKSYFYPEKQRSTVLIDSAPPSPPPGKAKPAASTEWSLFRPSTWGFKTLGAIILVIAAIVVAAVVPTVLKKKRGGYPDYFKINYSLKEAWQGDTFFSNFDFYTAADPTKGFVNYVGRELAMASNLTYTNATTATMRVDQFTSVNTRGRNSVRLVSKNAYNYGLFIFDVAHVPFGCATWPAIWMTRVGDGWPAGGEIDIFESVNQGGPNQMTLHTSDNCVMDGYRNQTGQTLTTNCYVGSSYGESCAVSGSARSAGQAFNQIGGGVFALEWRYEGLRMWFFERSQIPSNINSPDPSVWPIPSADFPNQGCDMPSHFYDLHIITNIALCGVWAGAEDVYNGQDHCSNTCTGFVTNNGTAFKDAYFTFNSFKIYSS